MSYVYDAECEIQKFCNSMACEGHTKKLKIYWSEISKQVLLYNEKNMNLKSCLHVYQKKIKQFVLIVKNLTVILASDFFLYKKRITSNWLFCS